MTKMKSLKADDKLPLLTIFTPAYNRAHTIGRTYESLCRQTCKNFEWLIIDDGSTDNTRELVEGWIAENKIPIRYIYQDNQGMHGAHNTAYKNIKTELNTCIDSDDWMPDDAVETILNIWAEMGSDDFSGIVGLDYSTEGKLIGTMFDGDFQAVRLEDFYNQGGKGDKKLVYRTDVINSVPEYPIFEGERYVGLSYKYLLVEDRYPMLTINKPLVIVDYQEDGSSSSMYKQYWNNPKGWMFYRRFELTRKTSLRRKFKVCIHYVSSCIRASKICEVFSNSQPFLTLLSLPFGVCLYFYIKNKINNNKQMIFPR